jgi:hypothetical protein
VTCILLVELAVHHCLYCSVSLSECILCLPACMCNCEQLACNSLVLDVFAWAGTYTYGVCHTYHTCNWQLDSVWAVSKCTLSSCCKAASFLANACVKNALERLLLLLLVLSWLALQVHHKCTLGASSKGPTAFKFRVWMLVTNRQ